VIRKDFDGLYYIDWINAWKFKLNDEKKQDWEDFGKKLEPLKKEIQKNISALKGQQTAYKNWYWMAGYYNSTIENLAQIKDSPDPKYFSKIDLESL
jgi:hypothetical protein